MSSRFDYEKIDVVQFLKGLGVRNVRDLGLEVSYSCPFDGHSREDSSPSASMSKVTIVKDDGNEYPPTTFNCFTCGKAGTAITFLSILENVSPIISRRMIRQQFGMSFKEPEDGLHKELMSLISKNPRNKSGFKSLNIQPEISILELEQRKVHWVSGIGTVPILWKSYMLERGFDPIILHEFEIGFDRISGRIAIPVFDEKNRLIGFKGRAWNDNQIPKYLVLGGKGYNFGPYEVSQVLFALNVARDHIQQELDPFQMYFDKTVMIVREGELNTIAMHQHGYKNTVGFSGQHLSTKQIELIKDHCRRVILWFDDVHMATKAAKKLERFMPSYVCIATDKDPAEMSREEIRVAISQSLDSVLV